jgi:5-methylcytosine-specific restriction endonuclease McrA
MTKRAKFSQSYRLRIAWLQRYRCKVCDVLLHYTFEVDHAKPLFEGGSNDESNLQALCAQCHRVKSVQERGPEEVRLDTCFYCKACRGQYSLYFKHECCA